MFSSVKKIIQDAKRGKIFILVDDKNRENEGDLVIPASKIDHKKINFMATHGRGLICLAIDKNKAKALNLSLLPSRNSSRLETAFTISIEARKGVTTGISAKDRAHTIKTAIKKNVRSKDISTPGHIFPLIAKDGGVLQRAGHTEAAVDIAKLSGCGSSGVICEIMNADGSMAKGKHLLNYAKKFNLNIARIEDLIAYRLKKESLIKLKRIEQVKIGKSDTYQVKIYENKLDGKEHIALIKSQDKKIVPRVRVISSNIVTSFLSQNKENLSINKTLNYYKKFKNCILIIIRDELVKNNLNNKKDSSLRNYGIGAQILRSLNIRKMILISKSKKNIIGLDGFGIKIVKQEFIK
jgi:3,4-dihydroxy 2-butanone 4-phosphate synthase / GTP cyclohydrolase II